MAPAPQATGPAHSAAQPQPQPQPHPNGVVAPIVSTTQETHATVVDDGDADAGDNPCVAMRKLMKGKDKEWDAVASGRSGKKLTLLELPVDILRLIVKEITHTNDLTALALTNSNLHSLAIPHIYSRFDIVWPDAAQMNTSDSKSVDALTYGLSTICLGSSFAHRVRQMLRPKPVLSHGPLPRRLKNDYAKYTRKFSLGNGPTDWVADYMISKESGKMLGTLVALAIEKMVNLEAFVWDMPTGVLSDIFMALASIPEHSPTGESKLEKVWVRWHDNSDGATSSASSPTPPNPPQAAVPTGSNITPIGILIPSSTAHPIPPPMLSYSETRVEFPTFSVLPPLRSLTVLDIDELAYLDEMATVIERSKESLRELRVGVSRKALLKDFVQPWDGPGLHQVDRAARWPGESTIGKRRLGGVLGVLVGRVYDIRRSASPRTKEKAPPMSSVMATQPVDDAAPIPNNGDTAPALEIAEHTQAQPDEGSAPADDTTDMRGPESQSVDRSAEATGTPDSADQEQAPSSDRRRPDEELVVAGGNIPIDESYVSPRKRLDGKLKLRTLELERVHLSIQVCTQAFDWTVLTNITILECVQSEHLWKGLRRQFAPTPASSLGTQSTTGFNKQTMEYHLSLKSIHTDVVSNALVGFLRDTLAPNSLEVLFLQDRRRVSPQAVTIEQIFKGVIKKHRSSLQKVLLDSSDRKDDNTPTDSARWRNWVLPTDMLLYLTSGRMPKLRELAISLHFKDWHTFLQRLPNIPQLRSLNLQHVADHIFGNFEPRELALQIVDIITLRPEIQLCYAGISSKCFEVLESKPAEDSGASTTSIAVGHGVMTHDSGVDGEDGEEDDDATDDDDTASQVDEETSEEEEEEEEDDDDDDTPANAVDMDDTQSEASVAQYSDDESLRDADHSPQRPRLRLREILFYDDKVAIFKARHGRL